MRKRPDEVEVEIDEEEVGVRPATAKRRDGRIWGRRASTLDDVRSLPLMAGGRRFKGGGGSLSGRNAEEGRLGCVCVCVWIYGNERSKKRSGTGMKFRFAAVIGCQLHV